MTFRLPAPRGLVLAIVAPLALFVALASWAFASPVGASPDDDYHLTSIWCAQGEREGICLDGPTDDTRMVWDELVSSHPCYAFHKNVSAACSTAPHEMVESDRGNFTGDYPPVYYVVMSVFASDNIDASVIAMRIANAAIFVGLGTALFFLLRGARRGPLVWGALASMVPLGVFLVPSVNPSSWAITAAVVLWLSLSGFLQEKNLQRRIGFGALALVATVMASGARGDAAVYSAMAAVLAVVLSFRRTREFAIACLLPLALVVIAYLFFRATGQSAIVDPNSAPAGSISAKDLLILAEINLTELPSLWTGALGTWGLGWLDTPMPALTWVPAVVAFFALAFWGLQLMTLRKGIAIVLTFLAIIAVPMYILVHDRVLVGGYVQPRYIYPVMIVLLGITLLGFVRNDLGLGRVQIWVLAGLLAIANGAALHTNIRRYVTGLDGRGPNLNFAAEWWWSIPVGPLAMWAIGTVAFSVALVALVIWSRMPVVEELDAQRQPSEQVAAS